MPNYMSDNKNKFIESGKKFYDPNIDRKTKIMDDSFTLTKDGIPLPANIEISNSGVCNRVCSFCPRSDPDFKHVNEFFPNDVHDKLCQELAEYNYKGIFSYCGFNEPLLKKDIYRDIRVARKYLPNARIEIVTNGDVLRPDRLKKLFDAGLTTLLISVYDGKKEEDHFHKMCEDLKLDKSSYIIRNRYMSEEFDHGLTLVNRVDIFKNREENKTKKTIKKKCTYPSYMFFIDYNGDVLMCSHDWGKRMVLGNVKEESFLKIWTTQKAMLNRKNLNAANRCFSPCNGCDVIGTLEGEKHANAWDKIIQK